MKKLSFPLVVVLLICMMLAPIQAASDICQTTETIYTEFGEFEIETTTIIHNSISRSSGNVSRVRSVKYGGKEVAVVTLSVTFGYDGKTAWVINASGSHTTSDGWSYTGERITTSGGTATLTATLSKLLTVSIPISISLTCSPTGQIS